MVQQLTSAGEPGEGDNPRAGRGVRYLRDETAPSAQRMVLGNALRRQRTSLGLKQEDVAPHLKSSSSKVSRIENGHHLFKQDDMLRFFSMYGISDPVEQEQLLSLAASANEPTWWQSWSWVAPKFLQAVVSFEDMAERIRSYEPLQLHGLVQTREYSRAVINRGGRTGEERDALAELREERKARFAAGPEHKRMIFIIDEVTLLRPVGDAALMRGQLEHLLDLSADPRYQFRVAELGRYNLPVDLGSTTIYDFAGILPTIVYAEGFDGGLIVQDERAVDQRLRAFDALLVASLAPAQSARRIRDLLSHNYRR
ncbi:helix-turn-helix domain-containing protein [Streptomyces sp. NPDC056716]|uniref:helix-turn-helix domain-containing protein n=1 Tax=unclassified Streptomyces TaxID=2593676 RepID=UPI00369F1D89